MSLKKLGALLILSFVSTATWAYQDCGVVKIDKLFINADRPGHGHSNLLLVGFDSPTCADFKWAYMDNAEVAYAGILSTLLTAYTTDKSIRIGVHDGTSADRRKIAWVNFQ